MQWSDNVVGVSATKRRQTEAETEEEEEEKKKKKKRQGQRQTERTHEAHAQCFFGQFLHRLCLWSRGRGHEILSAARSAADRRKESDQRLQLFTDSECP